MGKRSRHHHKEHKKSSSTDTEKKVKFDLPPEKPEEEVVEKQEDNSPPEKNGGFSLPTTYNPQSLMKNRKFLIGGLVVVGLATAFYMYQRKSGKGEKEKEKQGVKWADEEGGELEEYAEEEALAAERDREFQIQEEKMRESRNLEEIYAQINQVIEHMKSNDSASKNAKNKMSDMFGDDKAGYDSNLSAFETEQSFDTAFMMKSQLDDKRQGMIEHGKNLEQQKHELEQMKENLISRYNAFQKMYHEKYGTAYIPQPVIAERARMAQQQHHQQYAQPTNPPRQMNNFQAPPAMRV